jgi:hypothetical protein
LKRTIKLRKSTGMTCALAVNDLADMALFSESCV